jgi:hypothetical protein
MNQIVFLFLILILAIGLPLFFKINESYKNRENYTNYNLVRGDNDLDESYGAYPSSQTEVLVQDTYPRSSLNGISNKTASSIWWRYPTFQLGSYKQITNNIRYSNSPDNGRCTPASMCDALYTEKQLKSNYSQILPPVNPDCGTRINYYTTDVNLLPFRTNMENILY